MPAKQFDFYYDFVSPNAYLVHEVIPQLEQRTGASANYMPIFLGGIFTETNNQPPIQAFKDVKGKIDYMKQQFDRFIRRYSLEFKFDPYFPQNTVRAMRGAIWAGEQGDRSIVSRYINTVFKAVWVEQLDLSDADAFAQLCVGANLPAEEIIAAGTSPEYKQKLIDATGAAAAIGVFGSPFMMVDDQMFFGKDSLDDLEYVLGERS